MLIRKIHHSILLQRAWDKYGAQSFSFIVMVYLDRKANLVAAEQMFMDAAVAAGDVLYNHQRFARSSLGRKFSEETIAKFRIVHRRPHTEESKAKMSQQRKGRKLNLSPEQRARFTEMLKNRPPPTAETRAKMAKALMARTDIVRDPKTGRICKITDQGWNG